MYVAINVIQPDCTALHAEITLYAYANHLNELQYTHPFSNMSIFGGNHIHVTVI